MGIFLMIGGNIERCWWKYGDWVPWKGERQREADMRGEDRFRESAKGREESRKGREKEIG